MPDPQLIFTDRELDVMLALWEGGPATVAEVRERLDLPLAYTTVLTMLRTLESKGAVSHRVEGRAHRYFPQVALEQARRAHLRYLVRKLYSGSSEELLEELLIRFGRGRERPDTRAGDGDSRSRAG